MRDPIISGDFILFETYNNKDCHCVFAANKLSGEIIWSTEELAIPYIEEYRRSSPDSTRIPGFVELYGTHDKQGIAYIILNSTLYALDSSDGHVLWGPIKISIKGGYAEYLYVEYSNNVIYVLSDDNSLLALDDVTGNELWNVPVLSEETHSAYIRLHESNIYIISRNSGKETISAFASADGEFLWATEIDSVYYGRFFSGNTLVVGTSGSGWDDALPVAAFELDKGTNIWETLFEEKGHHDVFPSITKNQLFLVIDRQNNREDTPSKLVVMDSETGDFLWEFNRSFSHGKITYYVSDEIVFVGTQDGYLFALNFENGEEIWEYKAPAFPACFTEERDSLIVISENKSLFALDSETGAQKWSLDIEAEYLDQDCFESSRRVEQEDGYIYIVSNDRVLHTIDSSTGEETWSWYDRRFPAWRPFPTNKPIPLIASIDGDTIYIYNGGTLSGGLFALDVTK